MHGIVAEIRALLEDPESSSVEAVRAELEALPRPVAPADPKAAEVHGILAQAFEDTRELFLKALGAFPERAAARGYLELAEKSLLHAEELMAQARALARGSLDYGSG